MKESDSGEMDFWGHLGALRSVLFKIAAIVMAVAIAMFIFMPWIFDNIILAPCDGNFIVYRWLGALQGDGVLLPDMNGDGFHLSLISYNLTSQFNTHLSLSLWLSIVICFPVIIYLLWGFVRPGLYAHERRAATPAFIGGVGMFYLGIITSYFLVFPMCLKFLADYQITDAIKNTISLSSYISNFLTLNFLMGIAFELPLLCWLLGKTGLLTRSFFATYRRHAVVILLVLAAIITPTGDPVTLAMVFLPLYGLWELSAMLLPRPH